MKFDWKICGALGIVAVAVIIGISRKPSPGIDRLPEPLPVARPPRPAAVSQKTGSETARWQPLLDDSIPWRKRLELTDGIREGLTPAEVSFLFAALDHRPAPGTEEQWWAVLNEIMERMRKHGIGADQYAARLGELAADPGRPEVARDYAIQHLLQWISPADPGIFPGEPDPQQRGETLDLVSRVIRDPSLQNTSIPGTALLALADASSRLPHEDAEPLWDALDPYIGPLVEGKGNASISLHVSAIQAAALRGRQAHLPAIRKLAMDEAADPSLRLSSIAALGLYGAQDSRAFLESVSRDGGRFSHAAQAAVSRLDQHLAGISE